MPIPALPAQGSTSWYDWATGIHNGKADAVLPAHAGTRRGFYDPTRSLYNVKAANTLRMRAAMGTARAGTGLARLTFVGDSLTAGLGGTRGTDDPVTMLRQELGRRGYPVGELVNAFSSMDDPRISFDGGGIKIPYGDIGTGGGTATGTGTVFEIVVTSMSPAFTVKIDGGAATTFTPPGWPQAPIVYTVPGLSNAAHTATITASADTVKVYAAGFRQVNGVVVQNAGMSGVSSAQLLAWDSWQDPDGQLTQPWTIANSGNVDHDLIVLELGINDRWQAVPVDAFQANLDRLVVWLGQRGATVALTVSNSPQGADDPIPWVQYVPAIYNVADVRDLPLLDLTDRFGLFDTYNADGTPHDLAFDGVHLTPAGNAAKARAWLDLIAP